MGKSVLGRFKVFFASSGAAIVFAVLRFSVLHYNQEFPDARHGRLHQGARAQEWSVPQKLRLESASCSGKFTNSLH